MSVGLLSLSASGETVVSGAEVGALGGGSGGRPTICLAAESKNRFFLVCRGAEGSYAHP